MEHRTGGTVCIRMCYVYCTDVVIRYLRINKWARVLVRNVWTIGEFWQFCSSIPIWCCCNLLLSAIPLYRYVTVPIFFLFRSMVKSYGKELPTLTSIHHIRGSYQEDPRKKEGWKSGSWERITHKSAKEVIEKNVAYAVRLDITGTIAQISLWMSRLQHLLRLHQMSKLLRMHQLLKLKQLNHQGMKWRVKPHHYQHQKNHLSSLEEITD